MLSAFFAAAAQSPGRQFTFRALTTFHLLVLAIGYLLIGTRPQPRLGLLGQCLLVAGIVEGALLVGWRLTQLPKSQALEFLLASPLRPHRILLSEAAIGLTRLALVTLAGVPVLILLVQEGRLDVRDLLPLLALPFLWGWLTGIGLTAWAYEPLAVRRWGERLMLLLLIVYLVLGILAGEHLRWWLEGMPEALCDVFLGAFYGFHQYNPFGVMQFALEQPADLFNASVWLVCMSTLAIALLLSGRAALRFQAHYQERHYSPVIDVSQKRRRLVGDRPLAWWAVKRVSEYAGKVNLWLAGGFGILYALHTVAGPNWPTWMGRHAFLLFDNLFGVAGLATALMILGAVPAAFQYGLWDSNTQDRCRRLELLLLSQLEATDYWQAALAAAWARGRGYCVVAVFLLLAGAISGKLAPEQAVVALAAGMLMWLMYFALGFRAFASGMQASNLGILLTAGFPLLAAGLFNTGHFALAGLTPPGCIYLAAESSNPWFWLPGILVMSLVALHVHRRAVARCLEELQRWYERFHGKKVIN